MKQLELCVPCAARLGEVYSLQKVAGGVGNKVLCAECGRRRYGGTYTLDGKRTKESQT